MRVDHEQMLSVTYLASQGRNREAGKSSGGQGRREGVISFSPSSTRNRNYRSPYPTCAGAQVEPGPDCPTKIGVKRARGPFFSQFGMCFPYHR
jgi:hypothetical protein